MAEGHTNNMRPSAVLTYNVAKTLNRHRHLEYLTQ